MNAALVARLRTDVLHRPADGVASVQVALGALQYLDAFDIVDINQAARRAVEIHIVNVNADTLVEAGIVADSSNEYLHSARDQAIGLIDGHIRRQAPDLDDVIDAAILELLRTVCADGGRDIL